MSEAQRILFEKAYPQLYVFDSLESESLFYATDCAGMGVLLIGGRTKGGITGLTLEQLRALQTDLPHIIDELEGKNG